MNFKQGFKDAIGIVFLAAILGLIFNHFHQDGIPLIAHVQEVAIDSTDFSVEIDYESIQEPQFISLDQTKQLFQANTALFIDARVPELFALGHIPGAQNWPWHGYDEPVEIPAGIDPSQLIVIYCNDTNCDMSLELGYYLFENGLQNIRIFHGGWEEWKAASYPIEKGN